MTYEITAKIGAVVKTCGGERDTFILYGEVFTLTVV